MVNILQLLGGIITVLLAIGVTRIIVNEIQVKRFQKFQKRCHLKAAEFLGGLRSSPHRLSRPDGVTYYWSRIKFSDDLEAKTVYEFLQDITGKINQRCRRRVYTLKFTGQYTRSTDRIDLFISCVYEDIGDTTGVMY